MRRKPERQRRRERPSVARRSIAGTPLASAPNAPANAPATLYRREHRRSDRAAQPPSANAACSTGRNKLTSPADGFSVPTTATTNNGQKLVVDGESDSRQQHQRARREQDSTPSQPIGRQPRPTASTPPIPARVPNTIASDAQRTEPDRGQVSRQQHADGAVGQAAERSRRQQQSRVTRALCGNHRLPGVCMMPGES